MKAVLLRKGQTKQLRLDLGLSEQMAEIDARWRDAEEGERRSRARFAQNAIKPEEVLPEWRRWRELLGGPAEVQRFVERAMSRLDAPLETSANGVSRVHLSALPNTISERLASRGLEGSVRVVFEEPAPAGAEVVVRSHALPTVLAESLMEGALNAGTVTVPQLGRIGAWPTPAVSAATTVALLRLRYKITVHGRRERLLLVEEAGAIAFQGQQDTPYAEGEEARKLLEVEASGDLAEVARTRILSQARLRIETALSGAIAEHARKRAQLLSADHARVRTAGINVPRVSVESVIPADVVGLYVLIPGGM
jgi:hypothetical protein